MYYVLYTCAYFFGHYAVSLHLSPCLSVCAALGSALAAGEHDHDGNYTAVSLQDTRQPLDVHDIRSSVTHANTQHKGNIKVQDELECTSESLRLKGIFTERWLSVITTKFSIVSALRFHRKSTFTKTGSVVRRSENVALSGFVLI